MVHLPEGYTRLAAQAGLTVYQAVQQEINRLEQSALNAFKLSDEFKIVQTTTGIVKILGLTIMLETGDIHRFAWPGNYCEVVLSCSRISEQFLIPDLTEMIETFPLNISGFHADNGSEYINHQVAKLLNKLHIELTKSRSRHSNDNALA